MATTGAEDYYTQEHQISVAKYNPYQAIKLYSRIDLVTTGGGTSYFDVAGDIRDSISPFIGATVVSAEQTPGVTGLEHIKAISVSLPPQGDTRINVSPDFAAPLTPNTYVSLIISTMTNKTGDDTWPGDPDYLEDKFVRFSYRFKFDDNEYSLMAPFTQIAYIPKQDGFFLNGDEDASYQSTIVSFMENQVQNIGLVIPLPTNANRVVADYKIKEVEILFRESDGVAVKVLESISIGSIVGASGNNNYYTYDYQSRKPYKSLPEAQTTRVYDKVPVRAFSQESSGNRIIYGNYRDQHTPPANINYNCRISKKSTTGKYNNWVEYPNHSVKRNRNYQVGFILADKFGRQSPVILSSVDSGATSNGQFYFGSTIYSPYDISTSDTNVKNWFGDAIMVLVNSEIASIKNLAAGTPGLYAVKQDAGSGNGEGYAVRSSGNTINGNTYGFRLSVVPPDDNNNNIPRVGDYLRGAYQDFVKVLTVTETNPGQNQWQATTDGQVSDVYLRQEDLPAGQPDLKFAYTINDLGWYSYKIVVKQTQQEYYNVYLPGILNGYPGQSGAINMPSNPDVEGGIDNGLFPTDETNLTAFTVLFNDNINKIPRDLAEVGPDQKQYRSSVTLYGRVTNIMTVASGGNTSIPYNSQYYARINSQGKTAISHTSTAIARAKEVNMGYSDLSNGYSTTINTGPGIGNKAFYQIDTNPLISRISTVDKPIGATSLNIIANGLLNLPAGAENMEPYLAVYETAPVESLLDIYWETASEGLIVDLNADVLSGAGGATSFVGVTWDFDETTPKNAFVTDYFEPVNASGEVFGTPVARAELISQTNSEGEVGLFELFSGVGNFDGKFKIKYIGTNPLVFTADSRTKDVYSFLIEVETDDGDITQVPLTGQIVGFGALKNLTPSFNDIPDFSTTKDTQIILPGYPEAQWTTADPKNGSGNVSQERSQLQFTIGNPEDLPDNWAMNIQNGELTQAIPDGEFPGNPNGTYTVNIRVTDANGITDPTVGGDYGQLDVELNTDITIGYASVNDGAKSTTCIIDPNLQGGLPSEAISASGTGNSVTGLWYITEGSTGTYLNFPTEWANINNKFRIGTENHKSGTLAITANYKQENYSAGPSVSSKFNMGKVLYYYREIDNTGNRGEWTLVPRVIEYNKSGLIGNTGIQSPLYNEPNYLGGPFIVNGDDVESQGDKKFAQTLRAFDFLQMSQNAQAIEYVFIIEDLEQTLGNINTPVGAWVNSDDLHYPECIPWANLNIAGASFKGSNNEYQYFRSDPSSTYPNTDPISNANILYAETPYPEYVNQFFTDSTMLVPYIPNPENIGMELNLNYVTAIYPPLVNFNGVSISNVTFSTKLSGDDGVRLFNQNPNAGVNTMPTGPAESISNSDAGLTRLTVIV